MCSFVFEVVFVFEVYSLFVFEVVFVFGVSVALKIPLYRLSYMSYVCLRYACLYACLMYMSV